jgi:hypothetical protein
MTDTYQTEHTNSQIPQLMYFFDSVTLTHAHSMLTAALNCNTLVEQITGMCCEAIKPSATFADDVRTSSTFATHTHCHENDSDTSFTNHPTAITLS